MLIGDTLKLQNECTPIKSVQTEIFKMGYLKSSIVGMMVLAILSDTNSHEFCSASKPYMKGIAKD